MDALRAVPTERGMRRLRPKISASWMASILSAGQGKPAGDALREDGDGQVLQDVAQPVRLHVVHGEDEHLRTRSSATISTSSRKNVKLPKNERGPSQGREKVVARRARGAGLPRLGRARESRSCGGTRVQELAEVQEDLLRPRDDLLPRAGPAEELQVLLAQGRRVGVQPLAVHQGDPRRRVPGSPGARYGAGSRAERTAPRRRSRGPRSERRSCSAASSARESLRLQGRGSSVPACPPRWLTSRQGVISTLCTLPGGSLVQRDRSVRIAVTSSKSRRMRTACSWPGTNTSITSPRTANSPCTVTLGHPQVPRPRQPVRGCLGIQPSVPASR